jgi:hypothetical protein
MKIKVSCTTVERFPFDNSLMLKTQRLRLDWLKGKTIDEKPAVE